jgi:hypothetical protein
LRSVLAFYAAYLQNMMELNINISGLESLQGHQVARAGKVCCALAAAAELDSFEKFYQVHIQKALTFYLTIN